MIRDAVVARASHFLFEWLAVGAGLFVYRATRRRRGKSGLTERGEFALVVGCVLGAAIGNKLAHWLEVPTLASSRVDGASWWLDGQSIVGGLLGGWIGVEISKWFTGIKRRTGDDFVVPILAGILVGRIGCFLAGLYDGTYGLPTTLPWGVDFGDGVRRHPTQLYEWCVALIALLTWPRWRDALAATPGLAFRAFILAYLLWRLAVDLIKPVPYLYPLDLSGIQWLCVLGIVVISAAIVRDQRRAADV
jgi:prolipoprotein diacylglyceryltransferase